MTSDFNGTRIHTYVTFRVVDVVKGTYNQPEITLRFLGGTVGEISLDVSDSTLPGFGRRVSTSWNPWTASRSIHSTAWTRATS